MADFLIDPSLTAVITIRTGVMGKAEYKEDKQGEMLYVHPECLKEEQQNLIYHGAAGKSGKEVHLDTARIIVSGGRGMKGEEGFAMDASNTAGRTVRNLRKTETLSCIRYCRGNSAYDRN